MKPAAPAAPPGSSTELPDNQGYQLGGGLMVSGQMPGDDPKSGFPDQGEKFPDRLIQLPVKRQKIPCSDE
jgi:hypothetical protein